MSSVTVRSKHSLFSAGLIGLAILLVSLIAASSAFAQVDTFNKGDGHDGAATFANATYVPNKVAPVPGAVAYSG